MESCIHLTKVAAHVTKNAFKKADKRELHALMTSSCELFAACYNLCFITSPRQTRSQQSQMHHVEGFVYQLQKDVSSWLQRRLPSYISMDGKALTFHEELHVSTFVTDCIKIMFCWSYHVLRFAGIFHLGKHAIPHSHVQKTHTCTCYHSQFRKRL